MEEKLKEQLVTFKTAKLAKKKRFEPETLQDQILRAFDKEGNNVNWTTKFFYCWQPTQSLLQRWLREKHEIHIALNKDDLNWFYQLFDLKKYKEDFNHIGASYAGNKSYEAALEEGLQRALKLIKL